MAVEKGCCVHSVTSEHWKYSPEKHVLSPVHNLLCKTFFPPPLCVPNLEADVIGRRWESFESQTAMLSAFEVVIAVLLGICIMVVLVFIGYFFLKKRKKNGRRRQPPTATNSTLSTTEDTEHLFYSSATKPV